MKVEALPANASVVTCLGNDMGYENIFAQQIETKGEKGDVLIVLSGSGNSTNIIKAINVAKKLDMQTHAIVGFDGGKCLTTADNCIHFKINDMQMAEDTQLIVGHIVMQWLLPGAEYERNRFHYELHKKSTRDYLARDERSNISRI